jgi:hypothetical protein
VGIILRLPKKEKMSVKELIIKIENKEQELIKEMQEKEKKQKKEKGA